MRRRRDEWGAFIALSPVVLLVLGAAISATDAGFFSLGDLLGVAVLLGAAAPIAILRTEQEDATLWAILSVVLTVVTYVGGSFVLLALACQDGCG